MRTRTAAWVGAGLVAAGAGALGYASLIERNLFTLRRYDVPVLAPEAEPLRILHLSDLHLTPGQRRKQAWVAALAGTDPDLVVVTGDNLAHPDAVPAVARAYGPLFDYPGLFVFGSNDYTGPVWRNPFTYFDRDRPAGLHGEPLPYEDLRALFTGAGWVDLNNARGTVKAGGRVIEAVGVDDPHVELDDYPAVAGPVSPEADLHLGLAHSPEPAVLDAMAADGFRLLLAGHTHGGQVRVPGIGALVTNCGLDRRYARGLHRWGLTGRPDAGVLADPPDAGPPDAGVLADPPDAGPPDAGVLAGPPGAGRPDAGALAGPPDAGYAAAAQAWLHVSAGLGTHPTAPIRFACLPEASLLTLVPAEPT